MLGGFVKPGILIDFNARAKNKTTASYSIRGFYYCDTAESRQKNGFSEPPVTNSGEQNSIKTWIKK